MTTDQPERTPAGSDPTPAQELLAALPIRRNAALGGAVGVALAGTLYAVRVLELLGPAPNRGSPLLFLALAFVLATGIAGLVFAVLTAVSAARELQPPGE